MIGTAGTASAFLVTLYVAEINPRGAGAHPPSDNAGFAGKQSCGSELTEDLSSSRSKPRILDRASAEGSTNGGTSGALTTPLSNYDNETTRLMPGRICQEGKQRTGDRIPLA